MNKTIFYHIEYHLLSNMRTGVENVGVFLARELYVRQKQTKKTIVFVRWCRTTLQIITCTYDEIFHVLNYGIDPSHYIKDIVVYDAIPIHENKLFQWESCLFFASCYFTFSCREVNKLKQYFNDHPLQTVFILYDMIPFLKDYRHLNAVYMSFFNLFFLSSKKLICISEFTRSEFLYYCSEKKIETIPPTCSVLLPYQYRCSSFIKYEKTYDEIVILVPGTIEPRKQQVIVFESFLKFIQKYPDIKVKIITFGRIEDKLKDRVFELICSSNKKIEYLDIIDNKKLEHLYKVASFSCFVSYYEGFGLPIAESLWRGTPVLTANYGSMKEVASVGGCYTINTKNKDDIYNALEEMILHPEILEKLTKEIDSSRLTTWEDYTLQILNEIENTL
jgi:glycosyltransferase involved in cell wall biosynthesis